MEEEILAVQHVPKLLEVAKKEEERKVTMVMPRKDWAGQF